MTLLTQALARGTTAALSTALLIGASPALAQADNGVPDSRRIVRHTVVPGDTATGLAVRHHAWTAELIALNHLGSDARLVVGQRLRIPVVRSAVRHRAPSRRTHRRHVHHPAARPNAADPSRRQVRSIVIRTAKRHHVDPQLALAISWQEAGWQMHHVSTAGAIGAMQVLPDTGRWMSLYAGRRLHLRHVRDNVTAGVLLLRVLGQMTTTPGNQIAGYYQGVGAIREHGWYKDTRRYVASVRAIRHRLERGLPPA